MSNPCCQWLMACIGSSCGCVPAQTQSNRDVVGCAIIKLRVLLGFQGVAVWLQQLVRVVLVKCPWRRACG